MTGSSSESAGAWTLRLHIDGVESAGKAAMVEAVVEAIPGIRWARVDYALAHIDIRGQGEIDEEELVAAVEGTGCTLHAMGDDEHQDAAEQEEPDEEPAPDHYPRPLPALPPPAREPDPEPIPEPEPPDDDWRLEREQARDDRRAEEEPQYDRPRLNFFGLFAHVALWCLAVSLLWAAAYRFLPVPMTMPMIGDAFFGDGVRNQWTPLSRISPNLIRSVIASEDNEFCHHYGFDFDEIRNAIDDARDGGPTRGASTISQQTAKNAFLWTDHSYVRKALEVYFTLVIETLWPKRRIMEVYLNVAEWGDGIYGAEAAARHWFHKPASRLSALEAARLAAILPSPHRWKANPAGPYVLSRSYTIMARANSVDLNGDDRCAHP
jgi:monofunctional biosynthetic peptidoglycan transglycosylase